MVEQESAHPQPQSITATKTAGSALAAGRAAWDLSVEDVASNLNLGVDTIHALERDDYESLPGYTFVKGYIRSYANLLRLNPDELIATVDLKPERLSEIPTTRAALKIKSGTRGRTNKGSGIFFKILFTIVLLAALGLFGLNQLSNLDTEKLAAFLKLPTSVKPAGLEDDTNEIKFPSIEDSSATATGTENNGKKEALIRIE
jgi:cytoskeletal protein RodZ